MTRVIHLMPYDGIGGVEMAAKSALDHTDPQIALTLAYIFPQVSSRAQRGATFNPLSFLTAAMRIARAKPDILIASLWRSSIVAILAKLLYPRLTLITFIHNSEDAHLADRYITRLSVRLSRAVFFDSESSRQSRLHVPDHKDQAVISFLTKRVTAPDDMVHRTGPRFRFIFWGRLNPQKNLHRALKLFAAIAEQEPTARFDIIGPDGGEQSALIALQQQLGLQEAVTFHGPLSWGDISRLAQRADFYLQTSNYEGMAMSVTEAMQSGLVPIVTPVGEIATYCTDDNAIILADEADDTARAAEILALAADDADYRTLQQAAKNRWAGGRTYCEDLFDQLKLLDTSPAPSPSKNGS